jgi:hypothetical protein
MKTKQILAIFILSFSFTVIIGVLKTNAQIGIAVAKDKNKSSIHWGIAFNHEHRTERVAREGLDNMGFTDVYTLTGGESEGHNLTSGYYVVVQGTSKCRVDGIMITSFGLGASSTSFAEAEERAVSNLGNYCSVWNEEDGYTISAKGTFPSADISK